MTSRLIILLSILFPLSLGTILAEEKVPLQTKLPKPLFTGTPAPFKVANLEKPRKGKRPPFMVPPGTINLGAGKTVTSSDDWPVIGELDFVTDADKEGDEGYYVELGPEIQHIQIDLQNPAAIYAILIWHYHGQPRVYHDIIVQISNDPKCETEVHTVYNNDHDNSARLGVGQDKAYIETYEGRLIKVDGLAGRYVRVYSNGNTTDAMNHYIEVEVFGQPASS